jgi:hypothetical protein
MADQVMGPIDFSMAALVHGHLQQKGVKLYLKQAVEAFEKTDSGLRVKFQSGLQAEAQLVILSIGVRAETRLARAFDWQSKGGRFESCMLHFFFSTPLDFSLIKYKNRPCLTYSIYYYVQYFNHRRR